MVFACFSVVYTLSEALKLEGFNADARDSIVSRHRGAMTTCN